nr:IAP-5 [Pieris rapae granulovirus]
MDLYENRLNSFKYWTGDEDKEQLSLVGFYYTGFKDLITCYYCKFDSYNFTTGKENTLLDHKRYSPECPFYLNNNTNYINTRFLSERTVTNNYPMLAPHRGDYTLLEHRINSFINYPKCLKSLVNKLCDAGFYYTNVGDFVCCYACNVIVKNFTDKSDVWSMHKASNKHCPLLYLRKLCHNNNSNSNIDDDHQNVAPSAPMYDDGHYNLPKCLECKSKCIDAVLLPCFHFCLCQECALTCINCKACNVFTGGFFAVKIPKEKFNVTEHGRVSH